MQQQKTLAIMAAGLGSRFGSLKQLHPVYKTYAIIDFSIYDAISAGFNSIIFIVREEIVELFKARYSAIFSEEISVKFVVQDVQNIPEEFSSNRTKPWGTGHALLALKDVIKTPFALINADDFYGRNSFKLIYDALYKLNSNDNYFIGFPVNKTLSETGSVSRGECEMDANNYLKTITERTQISVSNNGVISYTEENNSQIEMLPKTIVSMNFWGFSPRVFNITEGLFIDFLKLHSNDEKAEFYLPSIVDYTIQKKIASYKMLLTNEQWFGVTYKEDEGDISDKIKELVEQQIYPENLW